MSIYEISLNTGSILKILVLPIASTLILIYYRRIFNYLLKKNAAQRQVVAIKPNEERPRVNVLQLTSIDVTEQKKILDSLTKLKKQHKSYCLVDFLNKRLNNQFYLINDYKLIQSIQKEVSQPNGLFQSQLSQPYLVLDSKCEAKLTKYEYEKSIKPIMVSYFQNSRPHFINYLVDYEFAYFMSRNLASTKQCLMSQKSLFELIFRLSTSYIKHLFDDESQTGDFNLTSGLESLMLCLYETHQRFTLGLFTKNSMELVNEYSAVYYQFLELIETEFGVDSEEANESDSSEPELKHDYAQMKFLIIKNVYLDSLKVYACITWLLQEISHKQNRDLVLSELYDSQEETNENAVFFRNNSIFLGCFLKTLTLDLYYLNTNNNTEIPDKYSFLKEDTLIALNMFNIFYNSSKVVKNTGLSEFLQSDYFVENFGRPQDFIQTTCQCLAFCFLKNFEFEKINTASSENSNVCDLPLIKSFNLQSFRVHKI